MRTNIWLLRHGQTEANRQRRYQSHHDSPLTTYGEQQHHALAQRMQRLPLDLVLVSPSARTQALAKVLCAARPTAEVRLAPLWRETNHGNWEGLTYREVLARFPAEAHTRWAEGVHGRASGGESLAEVAERVSRAWQELLREFPGAKIAIVTHATPIQLVFCAATGTPIDQHWRWRVDLGSLSALDVYGAGPIIRQVNEVPRWQFHNPK